MNKVLSKIFFGTLLCASVGVQASHIHEEFETFSESFMIPGHIYLHDGTPANKPTLFWCHGGPHEFTETLSLQNFAKVLDVNVVGFDFRGSIIFGYEKVAQDLQLDFGSQMGSNFYCGTNGD